MPNVLNMTVSLWPPWPRLVKDISTLCRSGLGGVCAFFAPELLRAKAAQRSASV
jgi:hypothetical protein